MHWVVAQFEVTLLKTQTARVQRFKCVCAEKRKILIDVSSCLFFEAEGFGLPCTAWAGSGLLVKSRLIRIRAD